jgi:hypothetical protein
VRRDAVQAAARYVRDHPDDLEAAPGNDTQRAVLAIRAHAAFLAADGAGVVTDPGPDAIRDMLRSGSPPR